MAWHHESVQKPKGRDLPGAKATPKEIHDLLAELLVEPNLVPGLEPVNPDSAPLLADHAARFVSLFTRPRRLEVRHTLNFVKLQLATPGVLADLRDLLIAKVSGCPRHRRNLCLQRRIERALRRRSAG